MGQNGIGVAPGAKWLACKGCQTSGCSESDLLSCGQYVVCPDGEENGCSMKPDVVSNRYVVTFKSNVETYVSNYLSL